MMIVQPLWKLPKNRPSNIMNPLHQIHQRSYEIKNYTSVSKVCKSAETIETYHRDRNRQMTYIINKSNRFSNNSLSQRLMWAYYWMAWWYLLRIRSARWFTNSNSNNSISSTDLRLDFNKSRSPSPNTNPYVLHQKSPPTSSRRIFL